jgi:UDP-glucose 4-epimerase
MMATVFPGLNRAKSGHVLVTGGAGYIGSHAVLALQAAGHTVTVVDNLSTGFKTAVPAGVRFHLGDVGDASLLEQIMGTRRVDAIMHFAGSIIVPESVTAPLDYYRNNTCSSRTLLAAAVRFGVPNFIFSSTAAVYGVPAITPIREDAVTSPINPYGCSKLMTEWMLRDVAKAHGLGFAALRYFNVAGADPEGRAGQSTVGATHLIKVATEVIAGQRPEVTVYGTDYATEDGTAVRDYVHVSDLASAHVLALDHLATGGESFVANCGYGTGFSVNAVLDAVERVSGQSTRRKFAGRRAGDPPTLVANADRIKSLIGWTPRFADLDQIVAHALSWERKSLEVSCHG